MPELPEVQTIVDDLNGAGVVGCTIVAAKVFWSKTVAYIDPELFCKTVRGQKILKIYRRAKYIALQLSGGQYLIIHLRMTGRFIISRPNDQPARHVHICLTLGDRRRLDFHDTRKFGRFYLVSDPLQILGALGSEPLSSDFTAAELKRRIHLRHRLIKPLLLDQQFIAGLGNIYADEALWAAGIHPQRTTDQLTSVEIKALHRAIRHVLRNGLKNAGTTLGSGQTNFYSIRGNKGNNGNRLKVFRRTGKPCYRCGRPVERITVAQRSTHICRNCQPSG